MRLGHWPEALSILQQDDLIENDMISNMSIKNFAPIRNLNWRPAKGINVIIGENSAMAACSVIAGSSVMGKDCTVAGLVGINGHINITDNCVFTGMAMVTKDVSTSGVYSSGMPAAPNKEWNKTNARVKRLDSLTKRVKELEQQLANK